MRESRAVKKCHLLAEPEPMSMCARWRVCERANVEGGVVQFRHTHTHDISPLTALHLPFSFTVSLRLWRWRAVVPLACVLGLCLQFAHLLALRGVGRGSIQSTHRITHARVHQPRVQEAMPISCLTTAAEMTNAAAPAPPTRHSPAPALPLGVCACVRAYALSLQPLQRESQ